MMLNEFLIFTAIILIPINAILIDHVSVRREILARIEKPVRLSQYSEKMIGAFNRVSLSALGANSAFSGMFSNTGEKVDILIHRGNNDVASGCFIVPPTTRGRSFLEELFLKEEKRLFGVSEEFAEWNSNDSDPLRDVVDYYRRNMTTPIFGQWMKINFPDEYYRERTDEARQELIDFKLNTMTDTEKQCHEHFAEINEQCGVTDLELICFIKDMSNESEEK